MKVVVTHHGADYERAKWSPKAKKFLQLSEKIGATWANKVISISALISRHLKESYNVDAVLIPNGVHSPSKQPDGSTLQRFHLTPGKYILSVGRLVPEKGMHDLIEAFAQTRMAAGGWKLVIAGGADHKDQYSQTLLKKAAGVPGVVMTGLLKAERVHELYANRGLFVLASYHEGLPIALLEALYHGPECVLSDIPANREVGLPDDRYFKTGNVQDLARKILHYSGYMESAELNGHFDVKDLLKGYAWDRIADDTLAVYEKLLGRFKKPSLPLGQTISPNPSSATLVQGRE